MFSLGQLISKLFLVLLRNCCVTLFAWVSVIFKHSNYFVKYYIYLKTFIPRSDLTKLASYCMKKHHCYPLVQWFIGHLWYAACFNKSAPASNNSFLLFYIQMLLPNVLLTMLLFPVKPRIKLHVAFLHIVCIADNFCIHKKLRYYGFC